MGITIGKLKIFKQYKEYRDRFRLIEFGEMFRIGPYVGKMVVNTPWFYVMLRKN